MPQRLVADRYRLVEMVGSGGMGVVWDGWDERLQRRVAVKQLRALPGLTEDETRVANERAMREARITARLHHRHAVSVFDVVDDDGRPCLIMQFVPSTTLAELVRRDGPLAPAEVARIGARVASALAAAHDLGIVHRDVKPGNVLIGEDGPLISDFGISRALDDISLTATGLVHGTPAYLSPEGARGEDATYASDVFCLGSTLYAALEGAPPFGTQANSIATLHRVAAGTIEPPHQSGPLTPLLQRMLSRDPGGRPTMAQVSAELDALGHEPSEMAPARPVPAPTAGGTVAGYAAAGGNATSARTPVEPDAATGAGGHRDHVEPKRTSVPTGEGARTSGAPSGDAGPAAAGPGGAGSTGTGRDAGGRRPDTFRLDPAPVPPGAAAPPPPDDESSPRRRRGALVALAAVLVAAVVLAVVLVPRLTGPQQTSTEPPGTSVPSTSAGPTGEPTDAPSDDGSSRGGSEQQEDGAEDTPAPPTSPAPTPSTDGSPTEDQLAAAITDYYALMPDDTDEAWPLMTGSYQSDHAGGRDAYEDFWDEVESVQVSDVTAAPPDEAQATLTYTYDDGQVLVEPTAFELVREEGRLKIAASTVLSNR